MHRDQRGRHATLKDVAALSSVSYQTVSRVINDDPRVRAETRRRVEAAIAELHFQPSAAARTLVSGSTRTIGVVVEDLQQYGTGGLLHGLEQATGARGWDLALAGLPVGDARDVPAAFASLVQRGVRSVVLLSATEQVARAAVEVRLRVPLIAASQAVRPLIDLVSSIDQRRGVELVVDHLVGRGRRRIAHIRGPRDSLDAGLRLAVAQERLAFHGLAFEDVSEGDWSAGSGAAALHQLAARGTFDAVFCANDQMALGALAALRELGAAVPGRVAVAGFDDVPEAAYFAPALTTVRQDFTRLGARLHEVALAAAGEGPDVPHEDLVPELVVRESA